MRTISLRSRGTTLSVFLPAFVLIALMSILWSLASPIFSSPDENAHASKAIALVRGELVGHRVDGVRQLVVDLPDSYRYSGGLTCFAFHPETAADCGVELGAESGTTWFASWVSTYNPTYYYAVGWPSLFFEGSAGIYAMRIVSALLCALLLAWAFQAGMASPRARWLPAGLAFLASPMVVYMAGSVNPQGIEIAAAAALWIGLVRLLESHRDPGLVFIPRWYLWLIVTVAASFLALARALGPLWVVLVLLTVFATVGWRTAGRVFTERRNYPWIAVVAIAGIFSVAWTAGAGSLSGQAAVDDAPLVGGTFLEGAWVMLKNTPLYFQQAIGVFGWLDTQLPLIAYGVYAGAVVLLLSLAASATGRRGFFALLGIVAVALLVPPLVQGYSVAQTGLIWQGRYALVLYLGVLVLTAWLLSGKAADRIGFLSVRITLIIAALLAAFEISAFVTTLQRYVVGMDDPITKMIRDPEWQPPLGWPTLVVAAVIVIIAFAAWVARLAVSAQRADELSPTGHA